MGGVTNRTTALGETVRREVKQVTLLPGFAQSKSSANGERFSHHTTTVPPHFPLLSANLRHELRREASSVLDSLARKWTERDMRQQNTAPLSTGYNNIFPPKQNAIVSNLLHLLIYGDALHVSYYSIR